MGAQAPFFLAPSAQRLAFRAKPTLSPSRTIKQCSNELQSPSAIGVEPASRRTFWVGLRLSKI